MDTLTTSLKRVIGILGGLLVAGGVDATPGAAQTPERTIQIPRVERPPQLESFGNGFGSDGTPPQQFGVAVTDYRQREPGDGTPVSQPTTAYLSYDADNLYVVFVCKDEPQRIRANIARREDIGDDDAVAVYLDTFHDRQRAYVFLVNPRGVQRDGVLTEGQDEDFSFDAVWQSDARLTEDGYVVRLTIPFRSLRFPRAPSQTWGIALGRKIQRNNEESYWPYITERVKGFVPQFAEVQGLANISPGRNIQLNPYTMLARARVLNDDAAAFERPGDERVGLDAKMVLRDALTLDATVNPDFSQVETDDPQVRVNERFDVFFPEKRPFFIENSGFFQTPVNLFHSRTIVDPGGGVRLTGKAGRWVLGAIGMNDRAPPEQGAADVLAGRRATIGVLRVQRQLGEESSIGLLATDRELGVTFNRLAALDTRLRFGDTWAFTSQVIQSETRAIDDPDTVRLSGFGAVAELERDGRHFDYMSRYTQFDPDFEARLGFVRRVGFRQMEHELEYAFRPDGAAVLSYGPSVSMSYIDSAGVVVDREYAAAFQMELGGDTELEVERKEAFELFEGFSFRPYSTQVTLASQWLKWLAVDASYEWGTAVNHDPADDVDPFLARASEVDLNLTLRPTPRLRLEETYVRGRLNTATGRRIASEGLLRSKLTYQFSRFLSLRAIVDFEAEDADTTLFDEDARDREWNVDLLLTYLVNPGTALYVGYADKYENIGLVGTPPTVAFRRSPSTSTARQLFVKLSYLLRL